MTPVEPIVPGANLPVTVLAKDQPEYTPLPAFIDHEGNEGLVLTRWNLTWKERLKVLFGASLYHHQLAFHMPVQPILLTLDKPKINSQK